jgi:hypothetical protein
MVGAGGEHEKSEGDNGRFHRSILAGFGVFQKETFFELKRRGWLNFYSTWLGPVSDS